MPGPVSSLDWFTACLDYALTVFPQDRISIGLPAYGYDWDLTAGPDGGVGATINYADVPPLIAQYGAKVEWDAVAATPWFTYKAKNGHHHEVWFENATSIALKAGVAKYKGVGASVWVGGAEWVSGGAGSSAYWDAIYGAAPKNFEPKETEYEKNNW